MIAIFRKDFPPIPQKEASHPPLFSFPETSICIPSNHKIFTYVLLIVQVMYMYYFLGDKLWASESSEDIKKIKSNNTFVLTLDGDVSFKPRSLALLLDLMKGRTTKVGAASGRVHPIGSGRPHISANTFV